MVHGLVGKESKCLIIQNLKKVKRKNVQVGRKRKEA